MSSRTGVPPVFAARTVNCPYNNLIEPFKPMGQEARRAIGPRGMNGELPLQEVK